MLADHENEQLGNSINSHHEKMHFDCKISPEAHNRGGDVLLIYYYHHSDDH